MLGRPYPLLTMHSSPHLSSPHLPIHLTLHLSTSSHRPLNSIVALLDHASMRTARYVLVVMIVVHVVTTAAAPGSVKQDKAKAGCDCKWAFANSCAPHSNDVSRCWGVCCNGKSTFLSGHSARSPSTPHYRAAHASSLPGRMRDRVAVCVVGQPRSAAQTVPMIRRHVLNVLDADAFLVLQIGVSSKGGRRLNQSLAIERLLGPRVRSAVHGTAQDLQPAGLANRLEQVAEPLLRRTPKPHTPFPPLTSSAPLPLPPAGSRRTARARLC